MIERNLARMLTIAILAAVAAVSLAEDGGATPVEELVLQERLQRSVDEAIASARSRTDSLGAHNERFLDAADALVKIGPGAIPFLAQELRAGDAETFFFSAHVLGRIGTASAGDVLLAEVDRAEREDGNAALYRKAWACYGLGLMTHPRAVKLVNSGRHLAGKVALHDGMSVLESIALHSGTASVDALLDQLERFTGSSPLERTMVLKALGRVPRPDAIPALADRLNDESPTVRRQAVLSLGAFDTPATRSLLIRVLDDPIPAVRVAVAESLAAGAPDDVLEPLAARLGNEENTLVRSALYRALAPTRGGAASAVLLGAWGRPDPFDRAALAAVLPRIGDDKAVELLRRGLDDGNIQVSVASAHALAAMEAPGWIELLLKKIDDPVWNLAQTAVDLLVERNDSRAAAPIARRLIDDELAGVVTDPRRFHRIEKLSSALVSLRDPSRLVEIETATKRQTDPTLVRALRIRIEQLQAIQRNGNRSKCWGADAVSSQGHVRRLAYRSLGRLGGEKNARKLARLFPRVPVEEGVEILRALANIDSPGSKSLIRRVLTAREFDRADHAPLRAMAAWSARRIGGAEMLAALTAAVERRGGRDIAPLVFLGVLGGEQAIPTLEHYGQLRMRDFTWDRANEMQHLDRLRKDLERGRGGVDFDVSPELLRF